MAQGEEGSELVMSSSGLVVLVNVADPPLWALIVYGLLSSTVRV
jgi:hypothetical protein